MEILYYPFIVFTVGYLLLRVTGKKAVSQMHTFDLLYIFVLTNIISAPVEESKMENALLDAVIIVILYKILIRLSLHNKLRWILYERPTVLIRNGDIDRKGLKKVRMPMNELLSHLRVKGYTDTQNIAMATMEETGSISVIPKSEYRPVQPNDLNLMTQKEYVPIPLIMDGQVIYHNLKYLQLEQSWLSNEVRKTGKSVENIMLATYLKDGKLFIDDNELQKHNYDPYYYEPGNENY
ncbi:DUF421 domain-containing protein [Mesobacillus jeotgali]|uniref:DUF421 domain-containing protein n=1 Tax=Mesobacillus jeotgali TaxID=129985 RepID=UPI0009A62F19|nr:DUF421 domain-containing protein [Mesobacillus jeotgali]